MYSTNNVIGITQTRLPLASFLTHAIGNPQTVKVVQLHSMLQRLASVIYAVDFENTEKDDDMDAIWLKSPNILVNHLKALLQHDPEWLALYLTKSYGNCLFLLTGLNSNADIEFMLACGASILCTDVKFEKYVDEQYVWRVENLPQLHHFVNAWSVHQLSLIHI